MFLVCNSEYSIVSMNDHTIATCVYMYVQVSRLHFDHSLDTPRVSCTREVKPFCVYEYCSRVLASYSI
jgi:hypothetical protein